MLPVYNSTVRYFEEQLESIRAQTYPHWECIIVDDGSTRRTPVELAHDFATRDLRFRVIERAANGGISAATNDGLEAARMEWITFGDHDDVFHPEALEAIATHIVEHPQDDLIYSDECMIDPSGDRIAAYRKPDYSPLRLLGHNYLCHIVTVRRDLAERVGGLRPSFEPAADADFNLRATEQARSVGHIPSVLYKWRAIDGSIAKNLDEKLGVADAVTRSANAALERREDRATATIIPGASSCRIQWSRAEGTMARIGRIEFDDSATPAEIDTQLRSRPEPIVVLQHVRAELPVQTQIDGLVALHQSNRLAVTGPRLVSTDGRLVSPGRIHAPRFGDLEQGADAETVGPWGSFQVTREAASVSPLAAVLDRCRVLDEGGLDPTRLSTTIGIALESVSRDLDLIFAVLCTKLRLADSPAVWTPEATVALPPSFVLDEQDRDDLAQRFADLAREWPALADDPYSPNGVSWAAPDRPW